MSVVKYKSAITVAIRVSRGANWNLFLRQKIQHKIIHLKISTSFPSATISIRKDISAFETSWIFILIDCYWISVGKKTGWQKVLQIECMIFTFLSYFALWQNSIKKRAVVQFSRLFVLSFAFRFGGFYRKIRLQNTNETCCYLSETECMKLYETMQMFRSMGRIEWEHFVWYLIIFSNIHSMMSEAKLLSSIFMHHFIHIVRPRWAIEFQIIYFLNWMHSSRFDSWAVH